MNQTFLRATGWSILLSLVFSLAAPCHYLTTNQLNDEFTHVAGGMASLLKLPLVVLLFLILRPRERSAALAAASAGGLGVVVSLVTGVLVAAQAIGPTVTSGPGRSMSAASSLLVGCWLIWANHMSHRHEILKGSLPWLGIVAGIGYVLYVPVILLGNPHSPGTFQSLWLVGFIVGSIAVTLGESIWVIGLGTKLIRGQIA